MGLPRAATYFELLLTMLLTLFPENTSEFPSLGPSYLPSLPTLPSPVPPHMLPVKHSHCPSSLRRRCGHKVITFRRGTVSTRPHFTGIYKLTLFFPLEQTELSWAPLLCNREFGPAPGSEEGAYSKLGLPQAIEVCLSLLMAPHSTPEVMLMRWILVQPPDGFRMGHAGKTTHMIRGLGFWAMQC